MLAILSTLLILLGIGLNRMSNRYFRRYAEQFHRDPGERMFRDIVWVAMRRAPPVLLSLFGYFLGLFLVGYGFLALLG